MSGKNGHSKVKPKRKSNAGAKTLLTKAFIDNVENLAAKGLTQRQICTILNVGASTFSSWKQQAVADGSEIQKEFLQALNRGEARGAMLRLQRIEKAGKKNWQADAWWLERRLPEQFGKRDSVRLSGPDGKPLEPNTSTTVIAPSVVFVMPEKKTQNGNGKVIEIGNGKPESKP